MKRWVTKDDGWAELFTSYRETAFRWECQQVYCSPAEDADLANFLAGRPLDDDWSFQQRTSVPQRAAGRVKTRVRVVVEPPTPYTRYELAIYPTLQELGTDVNVIAVSMGDWPADLPHHDFWLFDDRDLWVLHYHENFRLKGAELVDEPTAVQQHRTWRDRALTLAVPLADYLAGAEQMRTTT